VGGSSTITVTNSTLSGNTAVRGGGIYFNNLGTFRKSAGGVSTTLQGGVVFNQLSGVVDTLIEALHKRRMTARALRESRVAA